MTRIIDLRSDTVTLPTPAMREAMARASLGDDCYGEDPTVNRLQEFAAARMGKEAALLVSSGTMGNLVGILAHSTQGDEVIVGEKSHVVLGELSGLAVVGGLQLRTVPDRRGVPSLDDVVAAVHTPNPGAPCTAVIALENTHNRSGGAAIDGPTTRRFADLAHSVGAALHLDAARIFNAAVALGVDVRELTAPADSVTFCLSKGLAAPVGSVLCGTTDYMARAKRWRKLLGGAMRQAGIFAAAGIIALETMVDRLAEDHAHARLLAEGLAAIPDVTVDPADVQTNLVYFDLAHPRVDAHALEARLRAEGVWFHALGARRARMVTHYGITRDDIQTTLLAVARALT